MRNWGTLTLNSSIVSANAATDSGGGIQNQGTLALNNTTVSDNTATGAEAVGGGIYTDNYATLTLSSSTVRDNTAAYLGGGLLTYGVTVILNSTVSSNMASSGGGISSGSIGDSGCTLTLNGSTVRGNTATDSGGGIKNLGTLTANNSTLNGNSGGAMGGAIYNGTSCVDEPAPDAVVSLTNCTLSGNSAGQGGGVRNSGGTATFNNCTLSGNTGVGGGLKNGPNGTVTVKNSIIAYNKLADHTTPNDCDGVITSLGYNLVSDSSAGLSSPGDLNNTDPLLGPLADNGGLTHTHALLARSLAIDHVPPASCTVDTDQRGVARPQNLVCDSGAFEADCLTSTVLLNTGYNHRAGAVYSIGEADAFWRVTQDTDSQSQEPRPATAILQVSGAWHDPEPNSQWISSRATAEQNINGAYVFETRFCLLEGWSGIEISLSVRADDQANVYLNDVQILSSPEGTFWYNHDPASVTVNDPGRFQTGVNTLKMQVNNLHSVAMGLDLVGSVTGSGLALDQPWCCQPEASLSGQTFNDRNGNAAWDSGEPVLPGWPIVLLSGTNLVASTTTDGYGYYYFMGLTNGTYTASAVQSNGWVQTMPPGGVYTLTLTNAQSTNRLNFGNRQIVNPTPTNLTAAVVGGTTVQLSWPADHTGWQLEVQTNSLAVGINTNWMPVPGSTSTNQMPMPINPANGSVFYRLRYPE